MAEITVEQIKTLVEVLDKIKPFILLLGKDVPVVKMLVDAFDNVKNFLLQDWVLSLIVNLWNNFFAKGVTPTAADFSRVVAQSGGPVITVS